MVRREVMVRRKGEKRRNKRNRVSGAVRLFPERHGKLGEDFTKFAEPKLIGQPRPIKYIARSLDRAHAGFRYKKKPLASALCVGPTGVGKTYLAKLIALFLHDDEKALYRIDCQDYSQSHQLAKLLNAPPGYVGYSDEPLWTQEKLDAPAFDKIVRNFLRDLPDQRKKQLGELQEEFLMLVERSRTLQGNKNDKAIAEFVQIEKRLREIDSILTNLGYPEYDPENNQYFSVSLWDELERGSKELKNFQLGILDEGGYENSRGDFLSYRRTFIIGTSNVHSDSVSNMLQIKSGEAVTLGFSPTKEGKVIIPGEVIPESEHTLMYREIRKELQKYFSTEYINRWDTILYFRPLEKEKKNDDGRSHYDLIFDNEMSMLRKGLEEKCPILLDSTDDAIQFVIDEATDHPEENARLFSRKFESLITNKLESLFMSDQIKGGDKVCIEFLEDEKGKRLVFDKIVTTEGTAGSGTFIT